MISKNVLRFVLGLKIKRLRQKKGLSLKELAHISGLSHSYLNEIEKAKKYPKKEKLEKLAQALEVERNDLVSAKMGSRLHPLLEFLESELATNLPLSAFGISEQDVYELMSHAPEKFTSFLMTISEFAKSYDVSIDDLNRAALRAHLEVHQNYFAALEQLAESLRANFLKLSDYQDQRKWCDNIEKYLIEHFNIQLDKESLGFDIPSLLKAHPSSPILYLNAKISTSQKLFELVRAYGALSRAELGHKVKSSQDNFSSKLYDYHNRYFASSLLIDAQKLQDDLSAFFTLKKFDSSWFDHLLNKYQVPVQVIMQRLTHVLPHSFNFNQLFYFQAIEDRSLDTKRLIIKDELHLGKLHHPHGISLREHYCRRWVTTELMEAITKEAGPIVRAQISQMGPDGQSYFCLSVAAKSTSDETLGECFTLGILIDDEFIQKAQFLDDLIKRTVGRTCERCEIVDCTERQAPSTILNSQKLEESKKKHLKSLLT